MKISGLDELAGVKGARELVEYIALHRETERALCLNGQILALCYLAGLHVVISKDAPLMLPEAVDCVRVSEEYVNDWWSLHDLVDLPGLLADARKRIADGTVGEDWLPNFLEMVGAEA